MSPALPFASADVEGHGAYASCCGELNVLSAILGHFGVLLSKIYIFLKS